MFKDFCSRHENVKISYAHYYKKVRKMNISFVKFGEVECERCDLHNKDLEDIHKWDKHELSKPDENEKNRKPTFVDCVDCADFDVHIKTATEARERYREEKNREWTDSDKVVSVDMQRVMVLPRLSGLKVLVFLKCIAVFNETFAPVGGSKNGKDKATGVLLHEWIRGRSAADVVSKFYQKEWKYERLHLLVR